MNIAFLYEHPNWSDALLQTFASRNFELTRINVADLSFATELTEKPQFDVAINRINIMPSAERNPQVAFQTMHYLNWLELSGVRVINGARAHFIGASKALQNGIFSRLGVACPRAIAIYRAKDALTAAEQIGYPVIVKPNLGGSGSGIAKYDKVAELEEAVESRSVDLGIDRTGIVQEYIESDGFVYRVEVLGNKKFYSIRQPIREGSFNYCAVDGCTTNPAAEDEDESLGFRAIDGSDRIELIQPDQAIVSDVIQIIRHCDADIGGVEYLVDANTGKPCYYDFNPYSNFVTDGESLLGFSPENRYVDFIENLILSMENWKPLDKVRETAAATRKFN